MGKTVATTREIQGLYEHANSEGRFYLPLAKVELARFLDSKGLSLKEGKLAEVLAREESG